MTSREWWTAVALVALMFGAVAWSARNRYTVRS